MDLLQFDHEHVCDVFVDDQLGDCVFLGPVSIAQSDLLIVVLVERHRCNVKEVAEVFELHPENSIKLIVHSKLIL